MSWNRIQLRSLKTRVTFLVLVIFLIGIWSVVLYASQMLHKDMERLLGQQQFSAVSFMADEVNAELEERVKALKIIAAKTTPAMMNNPTILQSMIEDQQIIYSLFNNGVAIAGTDGTVIAEYPHMRGRIGANFKERDYAIGPLKEGKVTIGRPVMSKVVHAPAFVIGVPIRDTQGKVIGMIGGVVDLRLPNFLDKITKASYGRSGSYSLIEPKHRLIVTATDKNRVMETLPSPGINLAIDRFIQGYEGSEIHDDPHGVEVLSSVKGIPVAGWLVEISLPTDEVFAPLHDMLGRVRAGALVVSLLLAGLTWLILRRQLSPMLATVKTLATISEGKQQLQPLPVARQDEIGELITGFNRLLGILTQQEQSLKESEARFRNLTEMSSDFYWESDAEHRLKARSSANPKVSSVSVFLNGSPIGNRRWEIPYLSPNEAGWQAHREVLEAHLPFRDFELSRLGVDGVERFILISGDPVFDPSGSFKGYRGVGADITERKQSVEALRTSETRHASMLTNISDVIGIIGVDGIMKYKSPNIERWFGWQPQDLVGTDGWQTVHPDDLERIQKEYFALLENDNSATTVEYRYKCKDGGYKPIELTATNLVKDPTIGGVLLNYHDITERKRTETALRESEERWKFAIEGSGDGVWDWNLETGEATFSKRWKEMLGFAESEIENRSEEWVKRVHPEDLPGVMARIQEHLDGKAETAIVEFRMLAKDGSWKWILGRGIVVRRDAEGKPLRLVGTNTDFTERKQAEIQQRQFEAQLRESQKMEALGTLAGGVAHDFNNALAAIFGNVELARQDVGLDHPALESLEEIGKASRRAKALVQQILAFGRRQASERKVISLEPIVQEAVKFLRSTIPAGVSLSVACAPDAPSVLADATQIEQVLINLGSNAWHAIEGQNRAGLIEIRLDSELRGGLRFVTLTVRDNGHGMDEVTRGRIFEPFFTTKPVDKGTGLGLSVVYGIAQSHEADIEVHSALGEGTAFVIRFAAAEPPAPLVSETNEYAGDTDMGAPLALQSEGKRVLYVDDEESIVSLMVRLLGRRGYNVTGYTEPRKALEAVRANPDQFDLAVTDYNMPGMSGLDVARTLRDIRADLPVILISGYITEELQQAAPAAGVRELIFKADAVEEVCEAVARYANAQDGKEKSS